MRGTRDSHSSVQDLQSTTRHAELWILQIVDMKMGFPCPSHNVMIVNFSPCNVYRTNMIVSINEVDLDPFLLILVSISCNYICCI